MSWAVVYEKAIRDDGTLFFPQKLSREFLDLQRKTQGSYIFSNQYQNEVIPLDAQSFRREWFKYFQELPQRLHTFAFVDPAISQADTADYTGIVVASVDADNNRYVRYAQRFRITPTEIVQKIFEINEVFKPQAIGVEDVAYQKALLYFLDEEMRRRGVVIPVVGVRPPTDKTKEMKILGLVPRYEWGYMYHAQGLTDLEMELLRFPRGAHDDLIDALSSMDEIIHPPAKEKPRNETPHPNSPEYESHFIRQLASRANRQDDEGM